MLVNDLDVFDIFLRIFIEFVKDTASHVQYKLKSSQTLQCLNLINAEMLSKSFSTSFPILIPVTAPKVSRDGLEDTCIERRILTYLFIDEFQSFNRHLLTDEGEQRHL